MKNLKKSKIIIIIAIITLIILSCIYIIVEKGVFESKETINSNLHDENTILNSIGNEVEANIENIVDNTVENMPNNTTENAINTTTESATQNNIETNIEKNIQKNSQTNAETNTKVEVNNSGNSNKNTAESNTFIATTYQKLSYGKSENGRDLVYYSIAPEDYTSTILMNFAIHGYEDGYAKDAQLLVNLAEYLKEYYQEKSQEYLYDTRILIVPCANPDGLYEGTSNNGFGRCNAKGIDLNRDFDALHKVFDGARNYTQYPFSAKESQALRDLVYAESPNVVIDFHGWENCTIGDSNIASAFKTHVGLNHKTKFNSNCNGYFSYWAHLQGANSLLVEFKNTSFSKSNVAKAIDELLQEF